VQKNFDGPVLDRRACGLGQQENLPGADILSFACVLQNAQSDRTLVKALEPRGHVPLVDQKRPGGFRDLSGGNGFKLGTVFAPETHQGLKQLVGRSFHT
jgi:hypothetical protein